MQVEKKALAVTLVTNDQNNLIGRESVMLAHFLIEACPELGCFAQSSPIRISVEQD